MEARNGEIDQRLPDESVVEAFLCICQRDKQIYDDDFESIAEEISI